MDREPIFPTIPELFERIDLRLLYPEQAWRRVPFVYCPNHADGSNPNLAVYRANAYCFACGHIESALEHIKRVRGCDTTYAAMRVAEELLDGASAASGESVPLELPNLDPSLVLHYKRALRSQPQKIEALTERYGLTYNTLDQADVGYAGYAYTLPVYSLDGGLVNIRFRVDDAKVHETASNVRYWGMRGYQRAPHWYLPPGFRGRSIRWVLKALYHTETVYVTEGEFDALALHQIGLPAISGTYGARSLVSRKVYPMVEMLRDLVVGLCYDQDEAGRNAAHSSLPLLLSVCRQVYNVEWPPSLGKDPSALLAAGYAAESVVRLIKRGLDKGTALCYTESGTTCT